MRGRGITYDTGFVSRPGCTTREPFDAAVVRREMQIIRTDLHCTAVRVTGGIQDRLRTAAEYAAEAGLEVWYSPFTCDLTTGELFDFLADSADRAERLRRDGAEVVLLTGSEISLFTAGFLPGDTLDERLALVAEPHRLREVLVDVRVRVNDFLGRAVEMVRARFGGRVSYASLPLDGVDWTPFDIISSDAVYRSVETADQFRANVRAAVGQGKPFAVTEFGCTTYRGAAARGGHGDQIVEWGADFRPARLVGEYLRDEQEQASYLREQLDIFVAEGVDTAFVNTFARYDLPHRDDPREDFDLASYGVVKVLAERTGETYPGLPWEPKAAFHALADHYGRTVLR